MPLTHNLSLRSSCAADLPALMRIQAEAYSGCVIEPAEVMAERLAAVGDTCWMLERDGEVCAYLLAYKSHAGQVTPLGECFAHKPNADTFYLHDLALANSTRGLGLGPWLVQQVLAGQRAAGMRRAALVSVQGTQGFWQRQGFSVVDTLPEQQLRNLRSYNMPAVYMECVL